MSLPCDMIFEILLRIRVKTLFRFQCVSKSWKAMISDPVFRKAHRCRAEQNPLILADVADRDDPYSKIVQLQTWDRGTLIKKFVETRLSDSNWQVTTCLDLVCLHSSDKAIFWNLATEESIVLSLLKSPGRPAKKNRKKKKSRKKKKKKSPERTSVAVRFGYVSSTEVFKVLHVFDTLRPARNKHCCEVFTLSVDGQWRAVPAIPSFVNEIDVYDAPFVNGAIHFLPIYGTEDVGIAAFDLECEKWSMIPSPPLPYSRSLCMFLYSLRGHLCALKYPHRKQRRQFDIWLLKDYKKGLWVKDYNIDLSALNHNLRFTDLYTLAIEQDGRVLIQVTRLDSSWLYYYDPKGKNHEQIETPDCWFMTKLYVEGFSSLTSR